MDLPESLIAGLQDKMNKQEFEKQDFKIKEKIADLQANIGLDFWCRQRWAFSGRHASYR